MDHKKKIALVAHDNKKSDLLSWARFNKHLLSGSYQRHLPDYETYLERRIEDRTEPVDEVNNGKRPLPIAGREREAPLSTDPSAMPGQDRTARAGKSDRAAQPELQRTHR